jgi:uncharacterized protein (TIGR02598 family)
MTVLAQATAIRNRGVPAGRDARQRRAFSLLEVILAIGLVTFSGLVIFALLPVGLSSLRDAGRQIVETEIFRTIGAEAAATAYSQLDDYQASRFPLYFDNEGLEVSSAADATFIVRCDPPVVEPGGETTRLTVKIGYNRDPGAISTSGRIAKWSFLLVNRDLAQ